jgi:hypothetical protein
MLLFEPFVDGGMLRPIPRPNEWRPEITIGLELRLDFWSRVAP